MTKPTHDILLAENYQTADGEEKSYFTNIGSAWLKDTGNISCEVREGLAVSGRFIISPVREKKKADAAEG
ncbi:MAG: hypothetical protein GY755_24320 [Chloroflexi bacterium]|nr:hypothetical protein [Chloroflexota bacterium]